VNEFDPLFEDIYDYCDVQKIDIDTLSHEAGAAQMEINFNHGNALELADQAFLFKRTVRQTALNHNVHATFMAKPMQEQPGSSMHLHLSVKETATGRNLFVGEDGSESDEFFHALAGMQRYLAGAMALMAPYVNSYRRHSLTEDSPTNLAWGMDNRTVGLRVPVGDPANRRVEKRDAGADCNPYLLLAADIAAGLDGIEQGLEPSAMTTGNAYEDQEAEPIPTDLETAIGLARNSDWLKGIMGDDMHELYCQQSERELEFLNNYINNRVTQHERDRYLGHF